MYNPSHFEQTDPQALADLIAASPLAMLVSRDALGAPVIDHLPFEFDSAQSPGAPLGVLRAHVARANPLAEQGHGQPAIVVFRGPERYITPAWYAAKAEHGRVVPTWNYAVVHAHGLLDVFDDQQRLRALVTRLTARFESGREQPWSVDDAPADYLEKMLGAIRGIEIPIERIVGKFKLGQNRSPADRASLRAGLDAEPQATALAALTRRYT